MPTYDLADQFRRDLAALTPEQRDAFKKAVAKFIQDPRSGRFRRGLRVKGVRGAPGIFEMTWANDGRATFEYGRSLREGEPHVIWRRVDTHAIVGNP